MTARDVLAEIEQRTEKGTDGRKTALIPIETRLLARRTVSDSGCWIWTGAVTSFGYGRLSWRNHVWRVHRLSAHLWLGLDLRDTETKVCHHCDVPACFNPDHLYLGTQRTNVRDMVDRGRNYPGPKPFARCLKGHPLEGDNVRVTPKGRRRCRICANDLQREARSDSEGPHAALQRACEVLGLSRSEYVARYGWSKAAAVRAITDALSGVTTGTDLPGGER